MYQGKDGIAPPIRPQAYGILFLLFASVILLTHSPWLDLPYFWDEAGYYVPAALDFLHGSPIPHSVPPLIHPPAIPAYLAFVWSFAGFHPESTRCAMLLLASAACLFSLLLAIELLREARGMQGFLAAGLVCLSPVFFAQSMLAQLDMPAMLFTTLALWLFLRGRILPAAAACTVLVLVKETGIVAPLVFGAWLLYERRWRAALWFLAPIAVLGAWIAVLIHATGHWAGTPGFVDYNLSYPMHPLRVAVNALRRVYYLFFANLHWVGAFAIVFAWRTAPIFRGRNWRIASTFALTHIAVVTLLGGATLERYLLPVLPILYAAMAAGLSLFPRKPRLICSGALLAGLAIGLFVNPPYPFPYEDNLAFTDFVHLQSDAADYVKHWYSGARVTTIWPLTLELTRPEAGFVDHPLSVDSLPDLTPETLRRVDWDRVQVFVAFSRNWDPPLSPLRLDAIRRVWQALFGYAPVATEDELRKTAPFPAAMEFRRHGQWVNIYVNPRQPITTPPKPLRAAR
jgi:4-amino-4-deoxy-L-arabinose transferase-like glycosyltransferase